jgi:ferredoxin-NADP reductase
MVTAPFGKFIDCPDSPIWIATGTGIAPFISMLKSDKGKLGKLIHGVRSSEYFYFEDFLKSTLKENYIQCCSSCQHADYFNGRVTHYLKDQNLIPDKKYYLCGVAEMVVETRDLLISKGVSFKNIFSEIYF